MAQDLGNNPQIPLNIFAGLVTFEDPVSLPMGASPDCYDMTFQPGGASSRSCLQKIFPTAFGAVTTTYGKSWIDGKGNIRNIYLDSSGNVWIEQISVQLLVSAATNANPAVLTVTGNTLTNGQRIMLAGGPGAWAALNGIFTATVISAGSTFSVPINSTAFGTNWAGLYIFAVVVTQVTPGSYAKSVTAFGREYIAINNGLHGSDIPIQFSIGPTGALQIDRVTQDGPGTSPNVESIAIPPVAMVATGAPAVLNVTTATTTGFVSFDDGEGGTISYYTTVTFIVAAGASALLVGQQVTVAGNGNAVFNTGWSVSSITSDTVFVCTFFSSTYQTGAGGTVTISSGITMQRTGNQVLVTTATAHRLAIGYQAQISGVAAGVVGGTISSIVIDNVNQPGLALVTTSGAHGLRPGLHVSLAGIAGAAVGGGATSAIRAGQVVTVTMTTAHNLSPGAIVTTSGFAAISFNSTVQVLNVTSPTVFTFAQVDVDATAAAGVVTLNWPIPNTATPSLFQVQSAPSTTTFQVAINYSNGSWSGGTVTYAWNGTFYVNGVPSTTSFTYQQYGPNATAVYASGQTVTPFGQAAPGPHQMQVFFITRNGYTTTPSPPVTFVANGGQYISVSNIPIGPSNIVARALAFTGAFGAYFFYIPATPQVNGQIVGASTQINDNTTTDIVLDFSDPTLFAQNSQAQAGAISIQGNNLANQIVIDGALSFGYYGSRLLTWGQRNIIDNLLNMGFDGGYLPNATTLPTGWTANPGTGGALATGHYGSGWLITTVAGAGAKGKLSQSLYEDYGGAPVATPNTQYTVRVWLKPSVATANLTFTASITSASTAFSATATISGSAMNTSGAWHEVDLSAQTPDPSPNDLLLNIYASSVTTSPTLLVDELNLVYTNNPYLKGLFGSYVNNPEGMDGVSGVFGPVNDTHQVMDVGIIRGNLYILTLDPAGRLHETVDGITEPAGWTVNEVAANCGAVSAFCLTKSQADDGSAAGGEEFFAWYSATGVRVFGGQSPDKISQEIQRPIGQSFPGAPSDLGAVNTSAFLTIWGLNDPNQKVMYFGVPTGTAKAPVKVFMLSYLGLDSANEIASNPPVHKALGGKLVATDLGRKWSPWFMKMNGAALMYRSAGLLQPVFFAGNGTNPILQTSGFGNAYILNPAYYTDDDYGIVVPYYVTFAFPDRDQEQQMQLGGGQKMVTYLSSLFAGVGYMGLTIFYNTLASAWNLTGSYLMSANPPNSAEWGGGQATGQRFFVKFSSTPNAAGSTTHPTTDNSFSLSTLVLGIKKNARFGVRGRYP